MYDSRIGDYDDLRRLARTLTSCADAVCSEAGKVDEESRRVENSTLSERRQAEDMLTEWESRLADEERELNDLIECMNNADEEDRDSYRSEVEAQQAKVNRLKAQVEGMKGLVQVVAETVEHIRMLCNNARSRQQNFCSSFQSAANHVSDGLTGFCNAMQAEDERFRRAIQSIGLR